LAKPLNPKLAWCIHNRISGDVPEWRAAASLIRKNEEMESESFSSSEKHIFFLNFIICFFGLCLLAVLSNRD